MTPVHEGARFFPQATGGQGGAGTIWELSREQLFKLSVYLATELLQPCVWLGPHGTL